jgi:putative ABC transport system permease protein
MFTDQDVRGTAKVCVIGKTIVNQLYPNVDPIGQILRIRNIPFKVVGVLTPKGLSVMGTDQDDVVIIPYTSEMKRVSKRTSISTMTVQSESSEVSDRVQRDIADLLRQRHRITQGRDDDFTIRGQQEIADAATATTRTMTVLLGAIASVSLIVGGIGIMNIMLVSVTERTREIGIRMAVGAHGRDILLQFLIEAITLSFGFYPARKASNLDPIDALRYE